MRAHGGRCAVQPDLLFVQSRCVCKVVVEDNSKGLRDIDIFDGKLPGQEHLGAILLRGEVGRAEAVAVARDDGVGLAGVEDQHRAPDQWNAVAGRREVHVQPPVLAQKQIAEGGATILRAVVVVPRATAGHQGHVTGGQHVPQTECARPVGCRLDAVFVVWPAGSRTRQGQDLDVTRFQNQALRNVPFPIGDQPGRWRGDVDHT